MPGLANRIGARLAGAAIHPIRILGTSAARAGPATSANSAALRAIPTSLRNCIVWFPLISVNGSYFQIIPNELVFANRTYLNERTADAAREGVVLKQQQGAVRS